MNNILCYWELIDNKWKLVESYAVDDDGHSIKNDKDRDAWQYWMNRAVWKHGNEWLTEKEIKDRNIQPAFDDYEFQPIMGRMVVIWTASEGLRLFDFHPPQWISWLSPAFYEKLKDISDWASMFQDGHDIYFGSLNEVLKYSKNT